MAAQKIYLLTKTLPMHHVATFTTSVDELRSYELIPLHRCPRIDGYC
ncbi:hypothetical protein JOE27_002170 [Pseudomonas sp. M5]|nr:hypothetical protein [Pseudomonas sp. M5]